MHLLITTGQPSPPTTKIMMKLHTVVPSLLVVGQTGINTVGPNSYLLHVKSIQQTIGVSKISLIYCNPFNLIIICCMFMPVQTNPAAQKFIVIDSLSVSINQ